MLYFVTENKEKFDNSQIVLRKFGISLTQKVLPLIEIQSGSLEEIAKDKAQQAFSKIKKPLVVKDDGWYITSLNGFPGSYMKYMNQWLSPQDFFNLLAPYKNKEVVFKDALCYTDGETEKLFTKTITGRIVDIPKGKGVPSAMISTFRKNGETMAECINAEIHFADDTNSVWNEFGEWYLKSKS